MAILTLLALLSGCCALAYEILYVRTLTTVLGDMLYVHAALLSTFLVGIGVGARIAHRCFRALWIFELLTGGYALALPLITRWLSGRDALAGITASPPLTIATTVVLMSAPSLLIGFSIPLFSAYIKARSADRLAFQGVYKAYNLGAVLSVLGVELLLSRHLGLALSLAVVGAVNVVNGIVLRAMAAAPAAPRPVAPRSFPRRVVVALALASAASAAFQMFFLKLTYVAFSPHRENFAVALSVALLGIFLGTWMAQRFRIRFETFLLGAVLLILATYAAYLPLLGIYRATVEAARTSELLVLAHKLTISSIFALGPMIAFGATLPALMRREDEVAEESGHLLFVSSLANAAGYVGYVVLGHPYLSSDVLLLAIAGLALAGVVISRGGLGSPREWAAAAVAGVLGAVLLSTWQERDFYLAQWLHDLKPGDEVTVFKSGAESATLLRSSDYEWVSYNGYPSIFAQRDGIIELPELMSGVVPALSAPRLERALVIGFGTGITSGATAKIFERVDVVEINDAFYKMMPELAHVNMDVEHEESAHLYLSDGRAFVVSRENMYDAILSSVPAPTYYSASKIYTVEFYERVARALKPDGVFCQWFATPNMSEEGVYTILSALRKSFRHCDLRMLGPWYYQSSCSNEPVEVRSFSETGAREPLPSELRKNLPGLDLDEFFRDTRLSEDVFAGFEPKVDRENTDDHPVLEFMVVRNYQLGLMGSDPFFDHEDVFGIVAATEEDLADPARFVRKAAAIRRLSPYYFDKDVAPLLESDLTAQIEWQLWQSRKGDVPLFQEKGTGLGD